MKKTKVQTHFDEVAERYDYYKEKNAFYYQNLKKLLKAKIPKQKKVLEVGCGTGDLLASLNPKTGYGFDISSVMVKIASRKHKQKNLWFSTAWPNPKNIFTPPGGKWDYIFMSDVIEHLENPTAVFLKIAERMDKRSHLIVTMANPIWEPVLMIAEKFGMKMPEGPHKRISGEKMARIMKKTGLKVKRHGYELLMPVNIPFITSFANKYLEPVFKPLAFIEYFVVVRS